MKRKKNKKQKETPVTFADQYIYGENYSDKYDYLRKKDKKDSVEKAWQEKRLKQTAFAAGCILLFCLGYFIMSVVMERNAMPPIAAPGENPVISENGVLPDISKVNVKLHTKYIPAEYLDGGVMMDAVIHDVAEGGYNAVLFDLKRENGTLAYPSSLTAAATYDAVASPGAEVEASIQMLLENNIIPLARIYCFSDPNASALDAGIAVQNENGAVWTDSSGKSWLNPYSDYAREYISAVVLEVEKLGVHNIVLDGLTFPTGKRTGAVFPGAEGELSETVFDRFVSDLRQQVKADTSLLPTIAHPIEDSSQIDSAVSAFQSAPLAAGSIPVFTLSIQAEAVTAALQDAGIDSYILILSESKEEDTTTPTEDETETENE